MLSNILHQFEYLDRSDLVIHKTMKGRKSAFLRVNAFSVN